MESSGMKRISAGMVIAAAIFAISSIGFAHQIRIEPHLLDYGNVPIRSTGQPVADRVITLRNESDSVFTRDNINLDQAYFDVRLPEIAAVRRAMRAIWDSAGCYLQDHEAAPENIATLIDSGYVVLSEEMRSQWQFGSIGPRSHGYSCHIDCKVSVGKRHIDIFRFGLLEVPRWCDHEPYYPGEK